MANEPRWLPLEAIVDVAQKVVAATGEPFFIRDRGLLESACDRPTNHWQYGEQDVVTLAIVLLLGIAQNHPFEQGNKRTAFVAASMFLEMNGYFFDLPDSRVLGDILIELIAGQIDQNEVVAAVQDFVKPLTD